VTDEQATAAGLGDQERDLARIGLGLQPGEHLQRQSRTGRQAQQLRRPHGAHQRTVLDRVDFRQRREAGALGQQGDLTLPVGREVARRVRLTGNGFGMAEQVETHDGKVTFRRADANRTCSDPASVNQSPVRIVATALLLCAALTAETAAQTRYSTQGMRVDGTICVDAATGAVLAQTTADYPGSPASVTKLMTLLLVLEDVRDSRTTLRSRVGVTKEAANTGGSQIWLAVGETFTVEDMLYALMLKSANDVAVALAVDRAGSTAAFVARMNRRAAELGMTRTRFVTPNGLTYGKGPHDTTTARDLAKLAAVLCGMPEALRFTSAKRYVLRRPFKPMEVLNHNHLLDSFPGCDGLKTGWTEAADASIVTTAKVGGHRVIAVVLGCHSPLGAKPEQRLRDQLAADLMKAGLTKLQSQATAQARLPALKQAPKNSVKLKEEPGFWDWLGDLFSF
jgi:serine-type D-Ala-D-Ala carboxypeptidase (penicillin-binding protein 5/6)